MKKIQKHFFTSLLTLLLIFMTSPSFATTTAQWQQSNENNSKLIDHQLWQKILDHSLLKNHSSGINLFQYNKISVADKQSLKNYLLQLQKIDPREYKKSEQMAYWINLYNAITVNLILENYPVKSIKKLGEGLFSFGPWDDVAVKVAEQDLSLNDIEHKILRPIWKDPRIHYAVNCASYGCPNLASTTFTSSNITALLEQAAIDYINHPRGVNFDNGKLVVSSIYHWYKEDFGNNDTLLIQHLSQYAKPKLKQRLNQYQGGIDHDYDWRLNEPKK